MNKVNDSGYKGKVFFYKDVKYDVYICGMEGVLGVCCFL